MRLAAFDLGAFLVAQIVGEQAAFGFHHKVQVLGAVFFHQHGPVGVVGTQRRGHFEPAWQLGVELDGVVLLQPISEIPLGGRVVHHVLVDRLAGILQHVLEIAGEFFLLEQLLRIDMLVAQFLVLDAIDQSQALAAVDGFGGQFDELLRVALEIMKAAASRQDADDGATGELGAILQVGQQVRQLDIRLIQHHGRRACLLRRGDARLADSDVGLAPLQPGLGNHRGFLQRSDAVSHQLGVVKLHAVSGLVLDAIP